MSFLQLPALMKLYFLLLNGVVSPLYPQFYIPEFNQLQMKNNWKKIRKSSKKKNLDCPLLTAIYMSFTLYIQQFTPVLQLFPSYLHCIRFDK